jgi:hypothetical protein
VNPERHLHLGALVLFGAAVDGILGRDTALVAGEFLVGWAVCLSSVLSFRGTPRFPRETGSPGMGAELVPAARRTRRTE